MSSLSQYGPIAGLVGYVYDHLAAMSTTRLIAFLLVNIPLLSIAFNAVYQLVSARRRNARNSSNSSTVAKGQVAAASSMALDSVVWLCGCVRPGPDQVFL